VLRVWVNKSSDHGFGFMVVISLLWGEWACDGSKAIRGVWVYGGNEVVVGVWVGKGGDGGHVCSLIFYVV